MKIHAVVVLGSALLLAAPLFAGDKTDVIVMKNGDRLTCEIKKLEAGFLRWKNYFYTGRASRVGEDRARDGELRGQHLKLLW